MCAMPVTAPNQIQTLTDSKVKGISGSYFSRVRLFQERPQNSDYEKVNDALALGPNSILCHRLVIFTDNVSRILDQ